MFKSSKPVKGSKHKLAGEVRGLGLRRGGFTIVELVVAIAVSALVIVTVSTALSRISRTRDVARTRLEAVTRAGAALDAVRRDLVSVIRDGDLFYSRVLLMDGTTFTPYGEMGRDEVLIFNNRLRPLKRDAYAGEGGEYESQYRIEDDRSGSVLWLRRDPVSDENPEGGGVAIPTVDGVVGIEIEAYDGEAWYPDWDSDVYGLPWALRVTVTATGESPDNVSSDPMNSTAVLRTQIAIDRIVPPPPPPPDPVDPNDPNAAGANPDAAANGDPSAAGPGGLEGGVPGGPGGPGGGRGGGRGGDFGDAGGPPGGGRPGGRPGGGRPGGDTMDGGGPIGRPSNGGGMGGRPINGGGGRGNAGGAIINGSGGGRGGYSMSATRGR